MTPNTRNLGTMRPLAGGDPIPLKAKQLLVGRRPSCDLRLDFDNISGKHCELRFAHGVWHVRDLNSTNGTTVNGQRVVQEHAVMPDDHLGIAGNYFRLDYEPIAPSSLKDANQLIEDELGDALGEPVQRRRSLMEMAGLGGGDQDSSHRQQSQGRPRPSIDDDSPVVATSPPKAPKTGLDIDEVDAMDPDVPAIDVSDDDFLKMIRDDIETDEGKPGR